MVISYLLGLLVIAVAAYLLIRIESKLDALSSSISQLATIISVKLGGNDGNKAG